MSKYVVAVEHLLNKALVRQANALSVPTSSRNSPRSSTRKTLFGTGHAGAAASNHGCHNFSGHRNKVAFQPIHLWHDDVHQDQVRPLALRHFQSVAALGRIDHHEADLAVDAGPALDQTGLASIRMPRSSTGSSPSGRHP